MATAFDITDVTDIIVPIYSVLVLCFIVAYQRSPETKTEDRYFLKKAPKVIVKKDWRELISGFFHQSDSDGFDDWLKFLQKPLPIRLIAPKMFHKMHMDMKLTDTEFTMQRSWGPDRSSPDPEAKMTLGTCEQDAPALQYEVDKAEDCGVWKGWVAEGEEKLHLCFHPTNPKANPVMYVTREVVDEETVLVHWDGAYLGNKCQMTSTYRRVE